MPVAIDFTPVPLVLNGDRYADLPESEQPRLLLKPLTKWETAALRQRIIGYENGSLADEGRILKSIIASSLVGWENFPDAGEFVAKADGIPTDETFDRLLEQIPFVGIIVNAIYSRNALAVADKKNS